MFQVPWAHRLVPARRASPKPPDSATLASSIAAVTEPTIAPTRPLSVLERQVVTRELQADARGMRFMGYFLAVAAVVLAGLTYAMFEREGWLMSLFVGATSVTFGWMSFVILQKRTWSGARKLQAFEAELLCETRRTDKQEHLYVGEFRVALRRGWYEFWPEGQVVRVELCLPPIDVGATWVAAAVVRLPGIDIQTWHDLPPPPPRLWLLMVAFLNGVFALVAGVILTTGDVWEESKSAIRNAGRELVFEDVQALRADEAAWLSRVTVRRAHRVQTSHGRDYLCKLASPSVLATINGDATAVDSPSEAEIEAKVKETCNVEEGAARIAALMNSLHRRQRQRDDEERALTSNNGDETPEIVPFQQQAYRNVALEECRESALTTLRRERVAQRRQDEANLLDHAVSVDPANACFPARFTTETPFGITELEEEVGVLDANKTWRSNARAPSFAPVVWFGLFALVSACGTVAWSRHRKRYLEETVTWKQRVGQRMAARHAA